MEPGKYLVIQYSPWAWNPSQHPLSPPVAGDVAEGFSTNRNTCVRATVARVQRRSPRPPTPQSSPAPTTESCLYGGSGGAGDDQLSSPTPKLPPLLPVSTTMWMTYANAQTFCISSRNFLLFIAASSEFFIATFHGQSGISWEHFNQSINPTKS